MKAKILSSELIRLVSAAARAVPSRSTLPVLGNLLLQASDGGLRVTGTNLETSISLTSGAKIEKGGDGAITVPAKTLLDWLGTLPGDAELALKTNDRTATINLSSDKPKVSTNIRGIAAEEFPGVPTEATETGLSIDPTLFKDIISRVAIAATDEEARPVLTAIHVSVKDGQVLFEAADGFRLARQELTLDQASDLNLLIPFRALTEFAKLVSPDGPVGIGTVNGNQAVLSSGLSTVVTQLVEGTFPDLGAVIPKGKPKTTILAPRRELYKAFKASDVFAREAQHTAHMKVIPPTADKPGLLQVVATSAETGDSLGEVDATITGAPIDIAFNTKYLTDVLSVLEGDQVSINLSETTKPGLVKPVSESIGTYIYAIMPMILGQ